MISLPCVERAARPRCSGRPGSNCASSAVRLAGCGNPRSDRILRGRPCDASTAVVVVGPLGDGES
jgi:hypothetical protein